MKKLLITFALLIAISFIKLYGQRKIKWEEAVIIFQENNINLKQSELKEQISKTNIEIAKSNLLPSLSFNANNQNTVGMIFDQISGKLITGSQWSNYATGSLNSNVVIYHGGQKQKIVDMEKINSDIAKLNSKALEKELVLQLLSLFTQTLINHDLWEASKTQLLLSEKLLAEEQVLLEIGKRTMIDFSQAKAKYANDKLNTVTTKNSYEFSMMKLKRILEIDDSENVIIVSPEIIATERTIPSYDLLNDPYLKLLNKQLELGTIKMKLAKTGFFPIISFNGSYGTNYSNQRSNIVTGEKIPFFKQFNENRMLYGNISISMPLFDGFKTKYNIRINKLEQSNLLFEKEKLQKERKQRISESLLDYIASEEELNAIQVAYDANGINYRAVNERYNIGKSSSIDLYRVLTEYNISEFKLINARYNMFYKREVLKLLDN